MIAAALGQHGEEFGNSSSRVSKLRLSKLRALQIRCVLLSCRAMA
jgi:hypothetical protein